MEALRIVLNLHEREGLGQKKNFKAYFFTLGGGEAEGESVLSILHAQCGTEAGLDLMPPKTCTTQAPLGQTLFNEL